ncbi:MAG: hypothetical protein Q9183_005471 [Haloplaca sp. 2 TL-2023]
MSQDSNPDGFPDLDKTIAKFTELQKRVENLIDAHYGIINCEDRHKELARLRELMARENALRGFHNLLLRRSKVLAKAIQECDPTTDKEAARHVESTILKSLKEEVTCWKDALSSHFELAREVYKYIHHEVEG